MLKPIDGFVAIHLHDAENRGDANAAEIRASACRNDIALCRAAFIDFAQMQAARGLQPIGSRMRRVLTALATVRILDDSTMRET
ncbi:hypothetical protein [Achromobacter arsenitoxydans]|uniref:hypothetical protein n=1 Tax=Achromobacter arsenitoxydans TaxID=1147684 RepID=UPI001112BB29|nr:hypothetical protein [Achromobacter arsenitoxydans]